MIGSKQKTQCESCGQDFYSFYDGWNLAKPYSQRFKDTNCDDCKQMIADDKLDDMPCPADKA